MGAGGIREELFPVTKDFLKKYIIFPLRIKSSL